MQNSILFGIVTYKEKFFECTSFTSLIKSFNLYGTGKLDVFIFDNTDSENWNVEIEKVSDVNITYFHHKDNRGISFAYNKIHDFALKNSFNWIVFLDQDTELPVGTYEVYLKKASHITDSLPIAIPKVFSKRKIISPTKVIFYRSVLFKKIYFKKLNLKYISCINSGLMITTKLFQSAGGYNEKLKLDFCDHDFIEKVKNKIRYVEILKVDFIQDFSADNNTKEQSITRYNIFVNDIKEYSSSRNKLLTFLMIDLPHLIKLTLRYKTTSFFKVRFLNLKK